MKEYNISGHLLEKNGYKKACAFLPRPLLYDQDNKNEGRKCK